jgi:hypothetical protein
MCMVRKMKDQAYVVWWLKFYARVCSWGLDLQFYSTGTVNKEMCP